MLIQGVQGKFIKLQFNAGGLITGATVNSYLLEKSRVVWQAKNERSFHIFYQIFQSPEKAKWDLTKPEDFDFINGSGCTTVPSIDDKKEYEHTIKAMEIMGFTPEERESILSVVAGVLHLGNIKFGEEKERAFLTDKTALQRAAKLLGTDPDTLELALIKPRIKAGREIVQTHINKVNHLHLFFFSFSSYLFLFLSFFRIRMTNVIDLYGEARESDRFCRSAPSTRVTLWRRRSTAACSCGSSQS